MRAAALLPILLTGCVTAAVAPPDGTPYLAFYMGGDNLYAASTTTYFADGTLVVVAEPHGENNGRGETHVEAVPGAYEAALAAIAAPTAEDLATQQAVSNADPTACCHINFSQDCTLYDGTETRQIPIYACRRAAAHRFANRIPAE